MMASGDRSNGTFPTSKNIAGDDQDGSKLIKYENLCLRDQAKRLELFLFAATNDVAIDGIAHRLLSCYHLQRLLFSHSKNNFSTTLTPTGKPRYTYCSFFVDSIYSKTIDIIRKIIFFSILYVKPAIRHHFACSVLVGPSDNDTILQIIYSRIHG